MEFLHSFLRRHLAGKPVPGSVAKRRLFSEARQLGNGRLSLALFALSSKVLYDGV